MIRINLLQVRAARERKKASVAAQLMVFLLLLAAEVGILVYLQIRVANNLAERNAEISKLRGALNEKRSEMSDLDAKKQELAQIDQKRGVIQALQTARTGPTYMLAEVMRIVSKGGEPTMDEATKRMVRQKPEQDFHRDWDYRRLWISRFEEVDRQVTIEGTALDVEDIGEFQRRLNLSQYFDDVRWVSSPEARAPEGGGSVYDFTLKGRAVYQ
jgi:type IV pilus assembly protein PilN